MREVDPLVATAAAKNVLSNLASFANPLGVAIVPTPPSGNVVYYSRPSSSFGYYRGWPIYGGDGAGEGEDRERGEGEFALGQGPTGLPDTVDVPLGVLVPLALVAVFACAFIMSAKA